MSIEPHEPQHGRVYQPQPVLPPPGWYPQGGAQRYWDGQQWTGHVAPPRAPTVVIDSGLPPIVHLIHLVATILTCGAWSLIWIIHAISARRTVIHQG